MSLRGRGRYYSRTRHWGEWGVAQLYRGGWGRYLASVAPSNRPRVTEFQVVVDGLAPNEKLRIAFLSDFHAGPTTARGVLERAVALAIEAKPDVVLLGGDYVFLDAGYIGEVAELLAGLKPPLGIYAVLGNHDLWADDQRIVDSLESAGATMLTNHSASVGPLDIVGIDDPWTGIPDVEKGFAGVSESRPVVVLSHAPEVVQFLGGRKVDTILCGHTHGGHLCLPGGRPVFILGEVGRQYPAGDYQLPAGHRLIVGRGIGNTEVPFRSWSPPEVLVVDCVPG